MTIDLNSLKQVDLFGKRTELSMNGQKSHKTWCGTFCTMFIVIACIISSVYYATEFFERAKPAYIVSELYDSQNEVQHNKQTIQPYKNMKFGANHFFAIIGFYDTSINLNDHSIDYTIYSGDQVMVQNKATQCITLKYFQDMLKDKEIQQNESFQIVMNHPQNFLCLNGLENDEIPFVYEDQNRIGVKLNCDNNCSKLNGQKLIMLSADYLVIPQNFQKPLQLYIMSSFIQLNVNYITVVDVFLQKVRLNSDYGYLLSDKQYQQQVTFRDFKKINLLRNTAVSTDPLLIINILPFSKRQIYDRDYPKLLTLVGIVGGLLKSLMVLGNFFTKPFSKLSMRTELVNELFTFEIKSEKKPQNMHEIQQIDLFSITFRKVLFNFINFTVFGLLITSYTYFLLFLIKDMQRNNKIKSMMEKQKKFIKFYINKKNIRGQGDDEGGEYWNKKEVTRAKSMTLGKIKSQQDKKENKQIQKTNNNNNQQFERFITQESTNLKTEDQLISIDNLNLQFHNNDKQQYSYQNQILQNEDSPDYKQETQTNTINQTISSDSKRKLYFRYPSTQDSSSINHLSQFAQQNNQQIDCNQVQQISDMQFEDQNNPTSSISQVSNKINNIRLRGQLNSVLGKKQNSIIFNNNNEMNRDSLKNNEQDKNIVSAQSEYIPQLISSFPVILPTTESENENGIEKSIFSSQNQKKCLNSSTIGKNKLRHSHSQSNDIEVTELQKELEQKNLQQRRNANYDREKKTFVKKDMQRNSLSVNQFDSINLKQSNGNSSININNNLNKKNSLKLSIQKNNESIDNDKIIKNELTKKDTLKKSNSKKESIKMDQSNKLEQTQQILTDAKQGSSSSRRIKQFFSTKTKEITNLIRFNIQQRRKPSSSQKNDDNTNNSKSNLDDQKNTESQKETQQEALLIKKNTQKKFDGILNEKQEKSIMLTIVDYIKYFVKCFKDTPKVKQMKYTNRKVKNRLDIIYILEKLIEIDKLKVLLLNPDQINLFDYMPKEFVSCDLQEGDNFDMFNSNNKFATWSLLCAERSQLDKYSNACIAYHHIQQNESKTKIDQKLIQMLDPQVKRYFNKTLIQPNDIKHYHSLLANYSMDQKEATDYQSQQNQLLNSTPYNYQQNLTNFRSNPITKQSTMVINHSFDSIQQNNNSTQLNQQSQKLQFNSGSQGLGFQRQNSQFSNLYSPASHQFQENIDKSQQTWLLPERLNERKLSQISPQEIYSVSPQMYPQPNQNEVNKDQMNFPISKRNNFLSQNSKLKTFAKDYCWQAPILEESNNMLSSEKFGNNMNSQISSREQQQQYSPKFYTDEKKSYIMNSNQQTMIIKNEDISFKNINNNNNNNNSLLFNQQQKLQELDSHLDVNKIDNNNQDPEISDEVRNNNKNLDFTYLSEAAQVSSMKSPTKKSGFDVLHSSKNYPQNNTTGDEEDEKHNTPLYNN